MKISPTELQGELMAKLVVTKGIHAGSEFYLNKKTDFIGKKGNNNLIIADRSVSREHAQIKYENDKYILTDLNSTNGTFINGIEIKSKILEDRDEIWLGTSVLVFHFKEEIVIVGQDETTEITEITMVQQLISVKEQFANLCNSIKRINIKDDSAKQEFRTIERSAERLQEIFEAIEEAYKRLSVLYRISEAINSAVNDPKELLDLIMDSTLDVIKGERGFIMLINEKNILVPKVARGMMQTELEDEARTAISWSIARNVMKVHTPVLTDNAQVDPRFGEQDSVITQNIRSVMCVPLMNRKELLGIIYVDNRLEIGSFSKDDLNLLTAIADQSGVAIANARLIEKIRKSEAELRERNKRLELELSQDLHFGEIVGTSKEINKVIELVERVAKTDAGVLITGENGTGKGLLARAIHSQSLRHNKPFVVVDCGSLSNGVLESELFGHERGAFTGAIKQRIGRFELANGGTLFLDEIGDMSITAQMRLLRVLEERVFERVGGTRTISIDVRVISATNQDLLKAIEEGHFREDLFYRLNVVSIELPPLRKRKEDIPLIANHFLQIFANEMGRNIECFDDKAMEKFIAHNWSGNVRELKNVIERAVIMAKNQIVTADDIFLIDKSKSKTIQENLLGKTLEEIEKEAIIRALENNDWNKTKVAKVLKIADSTLYSKIKKYDIGKI